MTKFSAIGLGLLLAACQVGNIGDPSDPSNPDAPGGGSTPGGGGGEPGEEQPEPGTVTLSLATTMPEISLAQTGQLEMLVNSVDGFAGPVTLVASASDSTWVASFDTDVVTLSAGDSIPVTLSVDVPSNGMAGTGTISVQALGAEVPATASTTMNVLNNVRLDIPTGTLAGTHPFGTTTVRLGTTIIFANDDALEHQIHSNNDGVGFPHGGPLAPGGATSEVTITDTGSFQFYCHSHGDGSGLGSIVVE